MDKDRRRAFDYLAARTGITSKQAENLHALLFETMIDPRTPTLRLCAHCGEPMPGKNRNAVYCSDKCRVYASRARA